MKRFSNAELVSIDAACKRFREEKKRMDNPEFYEKLAKATEIARAKAEANAHQQRLNELDAKIAMLKKQLLDDTEVKKFVKVGSSDEKTAKRCSWVNHTNKRTRIKSISVKVRLIPYVTCFGRIIELTNEEAKNYPNVKYKRVY